jgi:hypothetical protein
MEQANAIDRWMGMDELFQTDVLYLDYIVSSAGAIV